MSSNFRSVLKRSVLILYFAVTVVLGMSRCEKNLGACGGGGWTLVMKTDGAKVIHDTLIITLRAIYIER